MNADDDNTSLSLVDTVQVNDFNESYFQQSHSETHDFATDGSSQPLESAQLLKVKWKTIYLPPIVTLEQLSELHQQLQQYCGSRVQLIGKEVERIDTAALQLLVTFINHPQITVGWIDPSPQLCIAAQLLGLSSHLRLPRYEYSPEVTRKQPDH
ncbi:MAG: STAS domain-containing protein [Thioploca sp.]|nr:STAS domain-containing protein [Thioploca sp.]